MKIIQFRLLIPNAGVPGGRPMERTGPAALQSGGGRYGFTFLLVSSNRHT